MLSEKQEQQLQFLRDVYEISGLCSTRTYIWGGLVMDIVEGRFLREHGDIDCFTLNLLEVRHRMEIGFQQRGYTTSYLDEVDMLQVNNTDCHAAFNRLEIENGIAMWQHIGNEGTIFFPQDWLRNNFINFYDVEVLVSGAEFEYSIKANVKLLSPVWQPRQTDIAALEYWAAKLRERNIIPETVLNRIRCENPYWRRKGYSEY
jgi:hypothetical protein